MRYLKYLMSILFIVNTLLLCVSFGEPLTSEMQERLRGLRDDQKLSVIAWLEESNDYENMLYHISDLPMPERRLEGREMLKEHWELHNQWVLEYLYREKKQGNAGSIKRLWIVNSVAFRATPAVIRELAQSPKVKYIFEDRECFMISDVSAPSFDEMVADATTSPTDIAWGVSHIGASTVWSSYTGENVVVGVLDTGVKYTHDDLQNNMWINTGETPGNGEDDDFNGYIDDIYGYNFPDSTGDPNDDNWGTWHGTHTSGTVAGDGSSGTNTGVAPGARIMALKVLRYNGAGGPVSVTEGLQYGLDNGAQVFNLSIGFEYGTYSYLEDYLIVKNFFRSAFQVILTVGVNAAIAAGNGSSYGHYDIPYDISVPADAPAPWEPDGGHSAAIAVANINSSNNISSSSSRGPTEWDNDTYDDYPYGGGEPGLVKPDLSAPGTSITSCYGLSETGYVQYSGTSMAAPHLAGAIALMLDKNPTMTPEEIDSILETTALDLGTTGKDNDYGSGLIRCVLAILNTPELTQPYIHYLNHEVDPEGNQIFDLGETAELLVTIKNLGINANNVEVTLSESSPYVSLSDDRATYGSISSGENKTNNSNPFLIYASPSTPVGHIVRLIMNITADGPYSNNDTLEVSVGTYNRDYMDHETVNLDFTVTNFGSYGYFDPTVATPSGQGFKFQGYNYLFGGGFLLGLSYNNVVSYEYGQTSEWLPISDLQMSDPPEADQQITTSFIDPYSRIEVCQYSFAWNSQDYIIFKYDLVNRGTETISNFYTAVYCDWDIHYASETWYDQGNFSGTNDWVYMFDSDSPPLHNGYVGLVGLTPSANGSMVENAVYVYPSGGGMGWDDTVKFNFMNGSFFDASGTPADDWSTILFSGPFTLAPGERTRVGYAIVAGTSLSNFESNAGSARAQWTSVSVIETQSLNIPQKITLDPPYPNPFNHKTRISFSIPGDMPVELAIYDIRGRIIRTIVKSPLGGGDHHYYLEASNLASGVYLCRLRTPHQTLSRQLLFIK
ncbi:S8 family peptidase [bacterium]|nr:S8 family peptidase [bacterium]